MTDQLRAAENTFLQALERRALSPLGAFKEVIRNSAHAQAMDASFATSGGIDFYIGRVTRVDMRHTYNLPANMSRVDILPVDVLPVDVRAEIAENISRRKLQEIRKMMGLDQMQANNGGQAMEGVEAGDEEAQGQPQGNQGEEPHNPEVQVTDGITDGMSQLSVNGGATSGVKEP